MKKAIPILLAAVLVLLCACMKHTPADVADGCTVEGMGSGSDGGGTDCSGDPPD